MLNKTKGNMYPWVTHTWNVVKGICPHDCSYCYMKRFPQLPLHYDEKALKDNLGENKVIFVGSSCDMFADKVDEDWICDILEHCCKFPGNKYLFQTKNPKRYQNFIGWFPKDSILGITLETNEISNISKAPNPILRVRSFNRVTGYKKMVSIEPIMDFDIEKDNRFLEPFVDMIKSINPAFVSIGADSKRSNLPEPSKEKIETLIKELNKFTEVKNKDNLKRLLA